MRHHVMIGIHIVLAMLLMCNHSLAQQRRPKLTDMLQSPNSLGTEFWIAIPPNEINPYPVEGLEIYVASAYETEIEVYEASTGKSYKRELVPYEIRTLSDRRGETNWEWEVREAEMAVQKGIRITSTKPISVYVLNSKTTTSDGYMAIPVSSWGTEYLATTYYDFSEFKKWAGGFIVVSRENGTEVTIALRGVGAIDGKTSGGRQFNSAPFTITLNEGDVYMVKGDGTTRGVFDLTGSKITSTRPVGLISFHERTTMPNLMVNANGRNHLSEMTPPTSAWGKRYSSLQLQRDNRNGIGKGDAFRVIARDSNTRWTLKYYDHKSKQLLGQAGGLLTKAGAFADLGQHTAPTTLTHGFSVWEADKPIFVMQYSCSASWDGDPILDPFMVNVTPVGQYSSDVIFQSSTSTKFSKHRLNLIVTTDTTSPDLEKNLESLEIDGMPVWRHSAAQYPTLKFNKMPSGHYWTILDFSVDTRAHRITSNGKVSFGGFVYGYGAVDACGWPIGANMRDLTLNDTMPPVITRKDRGCGTFEFEATELRNIPDPPNAVRRDTDQIETGIAGIDTVPDALSTNYGLTLITDLDFPRTPAYKRFKYRWSVIDLTRPARCVYFVKDWYGNVTVDSCVWTPPSIVVNPVTIDYRDTRLGTTVDKQVVITNTSEGSIILKRVALERGQYYSIVTGSISDSLVVPSKGTHTISVRYTASRESGNPVTDRDVDSLVVEIQCVKRRISLMGTAVIPRIDVADYDAGYNAPGNVACETNGLRITNAGSDTLVVTKIDGFEGSKFSVAPTSLTALPYVIPPKSFYVMNGVCYQRNDMGTDSVRVEFTSNADGPKAFSIWKGTTLILSVNDELERGVEVVSTDNAVQISWTVEGIRTVDVINLRGQVVQSSTVQHDQQQFSIPSSVAARQAIIINLTDAAGKLVRSKKVLVP